MELLDAFEGFDWSALGENAGNFAIEIAKSETKSIAEKSILEIKDLWRKVDWPGKQKKYRENLLESISTTRVLGNPKSIHIENIYTDCYVFDKLSAFRRFSGDLDNDKDTEALAQDVGQRYSALEVALTGKNLFILGKPGAGKTTFLKYLAILCCKSKIRKTPIFISLKDWSDSSLSIIPYIAKQFDICGLPNAQPFVEALLERGDALVLLDGLDEVNEAGSKRSQTIREIVNLSKKYRKCQYCTTCRTAATDYSFEQFTYLEVADFDSAQQLKFIEQWHGDSTAKLDLFLNGWNDSQQEGLRDLGRTPLLLTLLCLAFEETLSFPPRQVDLYKEALDALLRKWDTSRLIGRDTFYKNLSFSRREHLLESIASKFYFDSRTAFRKNEVEAVILDYLSQLPDKEKSGSGDASLVLRQIEAQHGLIVERAVGIFTFSHLTLQEYFTASHIVKSHDERLLDSLVRAGLQDQKWREVILYTVGLLPSADPILTRMANQLKDLRGTQKGVVRFLSFCLCDALENAVDDDESEPTLNGIRVSEVKSRILIKVADQKAPPLTQAETAKISEHILKIQNFLNKKSKKYDFGLAPSIINSAADVITNRPSRAASLLGSYFFKPEDFISYLYACRLMIECLEVAVSKQRNGYIESVMSVGDRDIEIALN
jgi:hypothetical protein